MKHILCLCLLLSVLAEAGCRAQTPPVAPASIIPLDKPFLFAYLTWDKKARIENSIAFLNADGMTRKGGAGVNLAPAADLSAHAKDCPAVRVKVGTRNTLQTLKLMLLDTAGKTGTWAFALPDKPTAGFITLTPADGAALSNPNESGKTGRPDPSKIMQWQAQGDWGSDGAVDVQINGLLAVPPDAAITAQRKARADKDEAAHVQAQKDRAAARARYATPTVLSPIVDAVYAAAPDVLALQIHAGRITSPCKLTPYVAQPGDTTRADGPATLLVRGGQTVGYLIGPKHDALVTLEGCAGDPLLTAEADDPANYTVTSAADANFAAGIVPLSVSRKSKPDDWQQPKQGGIVLSHVVYLHLPHALTPGKTYTVTLANVNVQKRALTFAFAPDTMRSESVHVSQIGFRPDDPQKRAFLSVWMGDAGGGAFHDAQAFHVVNAAGNTVYTGKAGAGWASGTPEVMHTTRNFNGVGVWPLDFSAVKTSGTYRVVVDGVGCSYPFPIGAGAWTKAFTVQMQGFYNQRSGVALGPPYTAFTRPADFRPGVNDCVPVTQSTYSVLDGGDPQKDLAKGDTGVPVPDAWGGWHDAGDWNPRRVTHMRTTTFWQEELALLFPQTFKTLALSLPHAAGVPDILTEARFEVDCFRRLQKPDGGVPFGIETNGDPIDGEVSWKQSMPAYVYAPDVQSSYIYAQVAARMARALAPYGAGRAQPYRDTALKAFAWAEADRVKRQAARTWDKLSPDVTDDRTLAALELYALTKDAKYVALFEGAPFKDGPAPPFYGSLQKRDMAFTYACLPAALSDPTVKAHAVASLLADADRALSYQKQNAWGIASDDPGRPQFLGFYSTPHGAVSLLRAYFVTKNAKYLTGAVNTCLFSAGANPNNLVYTSGLGANPVKHVLHLDSRFTGQAYPVGLTVYGNVDLTRWPDTWITWPITYIWGKDCQPSAYDWPTTEAYFDVFFMPAENEFTMDQTMGPNAYVWGFLAARG